MHDIRRDFRQRFEDETAMVHRWMRDGEFLRIYDRVFRLAGYEDQNIDVNQSRAFFLDAPPAHFLFDAEGPGHELARSQAGFERNGAIQKPRLSGELYRLGFIKGREGNDAADRA